MFEFIEGDVIARPGDHRKPYGTVVFTPRHDWGKDGYLVQLFTMLPDKPLPKPGPGQEPKPKPPARSDTVFVKRLDGYMALPSAVRDVAGAVRDTPAAQAALDRVRGMRASDIPRPSAAHLRRAGFAPAAPVAAQTVVARPTLFDLADDDIWG